MPFLEAQRWSGGQSKCCEAVRTNTSRGRWLAVPFASQKRKEWGSERAALVCTRTSRCVKRPAWVFTAFRLGMGSMLVVTRVLSVAHSREVAGGWRIGCCWRRRCRRRRPRRLDKINFWRGDPCARQPASQDLLWVFRTIHSIHIICSRLSFPTPTLFYTHTLTLGVPHAPFTTGGVGTGPPADPPIVGCRTRSALAACLSPLSSSSCTCTLLLFPLVLAR